MSTIRVLFLLALLSPTLALAQAGRFLVAIGEVVVIRGPATIPATGGTPVHSGDTIRVGPSSNAQIRMSDESIVGLRPGTVFRIDAYAYSGRVDGSEKSLFSLLKGGMRTITGAIGKLHDKNKYAVNTPTSTVGIRGTHFILVHCDNDCFEPTKVSLAQSELAQSDAPKPGAGQLLPNGTHGAVTDGTIDVSNNTGEHVFEAGSFFFVANRDSVPQPQIGPSPALSLNALSGQTRNTGRQGRESTGAGGVNADGRSGPREQFVTQMYERLLRRHATNEETTQSGAPKNLCTSGQTSIQCTSQTTGQQQPMVTGTLYHISFAYGGVNVPVPGANVGDHGPSLSFASFDSSNRLTQWNETQAPFNIFTLSGPYLDTDSRAGTVAWGRVGIVGASPGPGPGTFLFPSESYHYVVGLPSASLPLSGTATYTPIGATSPTVSNGASAPGTFSNGTFAVTDFLTGAISLGGKATFTGGSYTFSFIGGGVISGAHFLSSGTNVTSSGGPIGSCISVGCSFFFNGAFFGPNGAFAGWAYRIVGPTGSVVGVAVFQLSDRRLKSNIKRIGTHPLGIGIYEYDIFGRHEIGVLAQEVETVLPEAVITLPNGFKAVNYSMINSY